jgi:hypothetical protein
MTTSKYTLLYDTDPFSSFVLEYYKLGTSIRKANVEE